MCIALAQLLALLHASMLYSASISRTLNISQTGLEGVATSLAPVPSQGLLILSVWAPPLEQNWCALEYHEEHRAS